MALDLRQGLKLTQSLLMTPQLQQAIKLLQLGRLELEQFVSQQLAENPVLEEGGAESAEIVTQMAKEQEHTTEDIMRDQASQASDILDNVVPEQRSDSDTKKDEVDWEALSRLKEAGQQTSTSSRVNQGEETPNYENIVTKAATLAEYLHEQTGDLDFSDEEKHIAFLLIGNIDERGYLAIDLEELARSESLEVEALEDILDTIQRLDPPGIAARTLSECLENQLRGGGLKNGVVEKIVANHMIELETRNFDVIAKALSISVQEVITNVAIIAELDPIPGRQFGSLASQYVIPDVYVFKLAGKWVVSFNEEGLPKLKLNEFYQGMSEKIKGDDKEYVQEKIKSAQWLIKSIQQRQRTIFKATECIVHRQMAFFEEGVHKLKPMILKDIAEDIEMHESTISRVTNNKYMHTPRGIFELKYFFNSSVSSANGSDVASESVKVKIKDIVSREDCKKPYSDQKIVNFLKESGIELARRTVAKYREQLGILPSSKRKKFY